MIELRQITKGQNKGMWSWRIRAPRKQLECPRGGDLYGRRQGIALSEQVARQTATRQINWHHQQSRTNA